MQALDCSVYGVCLSESGGKWVESVRVVRKLTRKSDKVKGKNLLIFLTM